MAETGQNGQHRPESEDSFPPLTAEQSIEAVGTKIGRYKLLSVLGEGGFGMVYMAEQERPLKRRVALKVIKPGMDTKQVIARFEAERQALALLDHPNIAHVFDAGTTDTGRPYFVMELVQGLSIIEYCDRHKLSIEQRLKLFIEVCEAIQYAHQKGIIHRDLKPSNIMVSVREGKAVPVVIDFGVAKAMSQSLTDRTLFTEQGQFIGTPEYMSPEQAEMTAEQIDTRSDIYSLGVMLYELLSGTLPFESRTLREGGITSIRKIIRHEDPKTPSTRLSGLGDQASKIAECRQTDVRTLSRSLKRELEWIPLKAMRKEPDRRYRTVSDLADDIHNYLQGNPLEAGPESILYRTQKLIRKHAVAVGTVMGFLLLLVTALIVSVNLYSRAKHDRTKAVSAAKSAREAEEEARKSQNNAERSAYALRISQAARHLETLDVHHASVMLAQCPRDLRGPEWGFLWQKVRAFGSSLPIFPARLSWYRLAPVVSADGSRILADTITAVSAPYGEFQTDVAVWNVNTASRIGTLPWRNFHASSRLEGGFISPHGDRVALVTKEEPTDTSAESSATTVTKITIWDVETCDCVTTILEDGDVSLAFSADGKRVVTDNCLWRGAKQEYEGFVKIRDGDSGDVMKVIADANDLSLALAYSPDGMKILRLEKGGGLTVWNEQGLCHFTLSDADKEAYNHAAWHPDSRRIACVDSNAITIHDTAEIGSKWRIPAGQHVQALAFSDDGHLIAWTDQTGMVAVTNVEEGQAVLEDRGPSHPYLGRSPSLIGSLAFTPDGDQVVTVGAGGVFHWNVQPPDYDGERIRFTPPEGSYLLSLTRDGEHIITTSEDQIRVYRIGQEEPLCILDVNMPDYQYAPSQASHDGRYLARCDYTDKNWKTVMLRVWDLTTGDVVFSRTREAFPEEDIFALSPDGCFIAFVEYEAPRDVVVYNVLNNARVGTYSGEEFGWYRASTIALSSDARYLAVASGRETHLIDTKSRESDGISGYNQRAVHFSPDGQQLLIDAGNKVAVFETGSARKISGCEFTVGSECVDFSMKLGDEHCRILRVPWNNEHSIELWDVSSGVRIFALGTEAVVRGVAFTEDGKGFMAVCDDGKVRTWDMGQGTDIPSQASDWYARGVALFQDWHHEWAVSALSDSIRLDPQRLDAYRFRGVAYCNLDRWDDVTQENTMLAVADFKKALELETDTTRKRDILADLGFSYSQAHCYEEAIAYFEKYLSQIKSNPVVYAADLVEVSTELIPAYARHNQHKRAQGTYLEMLRLIARFPEDTVSSESRVSRFSPFMRGKTLRELFPMCNKWVLDFYQETNDLVQEKEMLLILLESGCFNLLPQPRRHEHMKRVAWICATSPDPAVRNGKLAVKHAVRAWELLSEDQDASNGEGWWLPADYARTLAAAHAEAGDFKAAVEWELEAMRLWGGEEKLKREKPGYDRELKLYRAGKPRREEPGKSAED